MGYIESTAQLSASEATVSRMELDAPPTDERALVERAPEAKESSIAAMAIVAVVLFAVWTVFTVVQRLSLRRTRVIARA